KIDPDAIKVAARDSHADHLATRTFGLLGVQADARSWVKEGDLECSEIGPCHLDETSGPRLLQVLRFGNVFGIDDCYGPFAPVGVILVKQRLAVEITFHPRQVIYRSRYLSRAQLGELPHMVEPVLQEAAVRRTVRSVDEASELIDFLDQLLGTQSRWTNTVCRVKKV